MDGESQPNVYCQRKNGCCATIEKWMGKDNQTFTVKERMAGARQLTSGWGKTIKRLLPKKKESSYLTGCKMLTRNCRIVNTITCDDNVSREWVV